VVEEIDENLRGTRPGDIVEFDAAHPDSDEDATLHFRILVKDVKEAVLPDLDDEFASDNSEFETVDELRDDMRTRLSTMRIARARMALQQNTAEALAGLDDTITLRLRGSAGQSLAAFCTRGMTFIVEGDTNDYCGKGLCGAKLIVRVSEQSRFDPSENIITGNVVLYGATSGEAYFQGVAGERFCVRNSGANTVIEGVGDHACEYMTGGRVVILGGTGLNFAAGMSGGVAFVLDTEGRLAQRVNSEMVDIDPLDDEDRSWLKDRVTKHHHETGSLVASRILDHWSSAVERFVKVTPKDLKRVLDAASRARVDGSDQTEAVMAAARG